MNLSIVINLLEIDSAGFIESIYFQIHNRAVRVLAGIMTILKFTPKEVETNYSRSNETEIAAFRALGPTLAPKVFWVGELSFEGKVYHACVLEKVICLKDILQIDKGNSHLMLIAHALLCLFHAALKHVVVRDCHAGNLGVRDSGSMEVVIVDAGNSDIHEHSQKEVNQMTKNFAARFKDLKVAAVDDAVTTVLAVVQHKDVPSAIDSLLNMFHKIDFLKHDKKKPYSERDLEEVHNETKLKEVVVLELKVYHGFYIDRIEVVYANHVQTFGNIASTPPDCTTINFENGDSIEELTLMQRAEEKYLGRSLQLVTRFGGMVTVTGSRVGKMLKTTVLRARESTKVCGLRFNGNILLDFIYDQNDNFKEYPRNGFFGSPRQAN